MTDRVKGLTISLDEDIRVDDIEPLMNAIRCLCHVVDVTPLIADSSDWLARSRVDTEWREKLFELMKENK